MNKDSWILLCKIAALVIITAIAYLPVTECGFIWDDDAYVQNNHTLRSLDGLRRIWFDIDATPQYYPLVHTSYWIEYQLWKLHAPCYHLVNILLHALAALLLWRILKILQLPAAWIAAALFALHPVQVESVAWITERKNVLSAVFYFSAALAYLRYALTAQDKPPGHKSQKPQRSRKMYILSLALYLCALLSKTVTCTLPAALLLVLWWKKGKQLRWADVRSLAVFFIIGISFGLLTVWLEKHRVGALGAEWNISFLERCLVAGRVLCFYPAKLFWPANLTFIYPRWLINPHLWQQYLYPLIALSVISALFLARHRLGKGPLVAVLFFSGTLFPALGFFDVYPMRYSFVADHFQYLASVGLITLVAAAVSVLAVRIGRWGKSVALVVAVLILAAFGTLTWRQCHIYQNLETLWRDTLVKNPHAWMAHNNLGAILKSQGKLDEAISHFRRAFQLKPDHVGAHNNLGTTLRLQGKLDEAIRHYYQALQIEPDHADTHYNLGIALKLQGKLDQAVRQFRQALQLYPAYAEACNNLGLTLNQQGKIDQAITYFRRALQINPDLLEAHINLGDVLAAQGKSHEAVPHYRCALQINPDLPEVHCSLADSLLTQGKPDEAILSYNRALQLKPLHNRSHNNIAIALATQGKLSEALSHFRQALQTEPDSPDTHFNIGKAYESLGQPDQALTSYRKVLQLNPDHPGASTRLKQLLATLPPNDKPNTKNTE